MRREQPRSKGHRVPCGPPPSSPWGDGARYAGLPTERTMKIILQHPEGYFDPRTGQGRFVMLSGMKRVAIALGVLALVAVLVIGLTQAGGGGGGEGKSAGGARGGVPAQRPRRPGGLGVPL